jgi:hypothetical protein
VLTCGFGGRADGPHRPIERFRFERLSDSIGGPRRCALPVLWFGGEKPRRAYARKGLGGNFKGWINRKNTAWSSMMTMLYITNENNRGNT